MAYPHLSFYIQWLELWYKKRLKRLRPEVKDKPRLKLISNGVYQKNV